MVALHSEELSSIYTVDGLSFSFPFLLQSTGWSWMCFFSFPFFVLTWAKLPNSFFASFSSSRLLVPAYVLHCTILYFSVYFYSFLHFQVGGKSKN